MPRNSPLRASRVYTDPSMPQMTTADAPCATAAPSGVRVGSKGRSKVPLAMQYGARNSSRSAMVKKNRFEADRGHPMRLLREGVRRPAACRPLRMVGSLTRRSIPDMISQTSVLPASPSISAFLELQMHGLLRTLAHRRSPRDRSHHRSMPQSLFAPPDCSRTTQADQLRPAHVLLSTCMYICVYPVVCSRRRRALAIVVSLEYRP